MTRVAPSNPTPSSPPFLAVYALYSLLGSTGFGASQTSGTSQTPAQGLPRKEKGKPTSSLAGYAPVTGAMEMADGAVALAVTPYCLHRVQNLHSAILRPCPVVVRAADADAADPALAHSLSVQYACSHCHARHCFHGHGPGERTGLAVVGRRLLCRLQE